MRIDTGREVYSRTCSRLVPQLRDERRMFGAGHALLKRPQHGRDIGSHQAGGIEPEAGKGFTPVDTACTERQWVETAFAQHEPIECSVANAPDDVLADVVSGVHAHLGV